jgi:hypothetical protein
MPRVGDYSNCKIYKITSMNNPELIYYGHTCDTLSRRLSKHKAPSNKATSKHIIEKGDAIILLVEDYLCENEYEAKAREAFYILNHPCVNKVVPNRSDKESYKAYYEKNKEYILESKREYRESHPEIVKETVKKYRESHKDK